MNTASFQPRGQDLEGPAILPASPSAAVLFLHGFGANGADLLGIGALFAKEHPSVAFLAPDGPGRLPFGPNARFWFPLTPELKPEHIDEGAAEARSTVHTFIEAALEELELSTDKLLLIGFSQGGMMTLETGLRMATPAAALMSFSGALAGAHRLNQEIKVRPPVFLGHGEADEVVPFAAQARAKDHLEAAQVPLECEAYPGLGHGISDQGIAAMARYISRLA